VRLSSLQIGEQAVITSVRLGIEARKKLLTYGIGLGTIIKLDYNPAFSSLLNINIQGKSVCIRKRDAALIEVIKYADE
jgi:Fe2+ transport system protein FeoA